MSTLPEPAQAGTANGLDNPTLAIGLAGIADFKSGMQFLDIAKMMRPWIGHTPGGWGGIDYAELRDGGYLDDQGWVTAIPEEAKSVGTIWAWNKRSEDWAEHREGVYVLEYEGEGELVVNGDAEILSEEPGRIVFESRRGDNLYLWINETDPEGTGDYIRNISIVREDHLDLYEAGGVFNPDWLELIADARQIRFMSWQKMSGSQPITWEGRSTPEGYKGNDGVPVEYMVQLANEVGADPWFCMPHMADENYIREFATYVRDNLDPELTVRVEYANEAWNWAFNSTKWLLKQSQEEWGVNAHVDYHAKMAVKTALIWEEVFGDQADARLVNVVGAQASTPGIAERLLNPVVWAENEPDTYVDPASVFEEVAISNYFGSKSVASPEMRDELIAMIHDPDVDATVWLAEKLMDPDYRGSIPFNQAKWAANAEVAHSHGLGLVAYEGGQHVHHSFAVRDLTREDRDLLTEFMTDFVRSEQMAELYQQAWNAWAEVADGPFMQFADVTESTQWGSWGMYSHLNDANPRADMLTALNESETPWWDDAEGGGRYQQGVTLNGTDDDDLMTGTFQEDYLLGGGGNDIFVAGAGNDGINGGDGTDMLRLSGTAGDYEIYEEGEGYRLIGREGSDLLIDVETLEFDDGTILTLSTMERQLRLEPEPGETEPEQVAPQLEPAPEDEEAGAPADEAQATPASDSAPQISSPQDVAGIGGGPVHGHVAAAGAWLDAAGLDSVAVEFAPTSKYGVKIEGVHSASALGHQLGLNEDASASAYALYAREASVRFGDQEVGGSFWSMQQNRAERDGERLSDTALDTALAIGSVVTDAGAIVATSANDVFSGRDADDTVFAGDGKDTLLGRAGDDVLYGGASVDRLFGGAGDDTLVGGADRDYLWGNAGRDTFIFGAGCGTDTIYGFTAEDTVDLGDFLAPGQTIEEAASDVDGDLLISNGEDTITFSKLSTEDIGWIFPGLAA